MTPFPVVQVLAFDPIPLAHHIEATAASYLIHDGYAAGIYIAGQAQPAMHHNKEYFRRSTDTAGRVFHIPVKHLADVIGDVYDVNAEIVISARLKPHHLSMEPTVPVLGLKIVMAYAKHLLTSNSAWLGKNPHTTADVLREFIQPKWHYTVEVFELLENLMIDLRSDLLQFVGRDKWIMHFVKMHGRDMVVEKTIDYRIYCWELEHGEQHRQRFPFS